MTILLTLTAVVVVALLCGALYQAIGSARDARRYPPPGRLLDVGSHRLHVHTMGAGQPPVLLEAGIAASSLSWQLIQPELAAFTSVSSYDRAGLGWSEPSPSPPTLENILGGLRAVIQGMPAPVVLVGHSFGGLVALEYARINPAHVAGLVLIDPLPANEWHPTTPASQAMLRRGILLARRGAWVVRLGVVRMSLDLLRAGSRRIPKLAARLSSGNGSALTERLVGEVQKLPKSLWPIIQAHWCQPKCFLSMAGHLESLPANASACQTHLNLGDLPLIVLSAGDSSPARRAEHQAMANLSSRGRLIVAEGCGHWIQLDAPKLVLASILEVVNAHRVRTSFPVKV